MPDRPSIRIPKYRIHKPTGLAVVRLTHRCHIFEMNGESFRFRESVKSKKGAEAPRKGSTKAES